MSDFNNGIEYIFISLDGTKRYETCFGPAGVLCAKSMYDARLAVPLRHWNALNETAQKDLVKGCLGNTETAQDRPEFYPGMPGSI